MSNKNTSMKHGRRPMESLGRMVHDRRGKRTLREAAAEAGVSSATLLRVEAGRVPDVETFGKLCRWLEVDPKVFLGAPEPSSEGGIATPAVQFSAHFRADREPRPETLNALAQMLLLAARSQRPTERAEPDEPAPSGI